MSGHTPSVPAENDPRGSLPAIGQALDGNRNFNDHAVILSMRGAVVLDSSRRPWRVHHWCEMCGRYSLTADIGELARRFEFDSDWEAFDRRYDIAPTQEVLTVVGGETRRGGHALGTHSRVGQESLHREPHDERQAETVAEKPAFRDAFRRRRCLLLADGIYEWQQVDDAKRPTRVVMLAGDPFTFAGLWSVRHTSRAATGSLGAQLSRPRPTTCSLPSTEGCPSSFPGIRKSSGWTGASLTQTRLAAC